MSTKFIFVTGGVVSGLGKGICAASLGRLLKQRGLRVRNQKFDPYLNVDPGTMSPFQHGEVFVTEDGAETDLDLGHYERFVDEDLSGNASVSSGRVWWNVLNRERRGDYLGATVQIIPHITGEIKSRVYAMAEEDVDVVIAEIGGTVGDIESQPFLEAIRQIRAERPLGDVLFIHVPLIVSIPGSGEQKSKPTQHSVKELLSLGIQPDILVCRCDEPIGEDVRRKIALFCNVTPECVIQNTTAETLYEVPLLLAKEGLDDVVCRKLGLITPQPDLREWSAMVKREKNVHRKVEIALVGKYTQLHDAYLSVVEALHHAGTAHDATVTIRWVDSETLTAENIRESLAGCGGVLVPGGFGGRGIEGMILAAQYARENHVPYLGICLGMQMAVTEFARHAPHLLSGGQKQRVAIAGVIAMEPECIVLDEATAMLDPAGRREVLDTVHRLNRQRGITVVHITHHMSEAEDADRVIVMNDGVVAMDGTPRDIFSRVEELRSLGLAAPDTVELLHRLNEHGMSLPLTAITVDECARAIFQALHGAEGK